MKDNKKQTSCEQTSSLTQVSTTYARICVILLALNFCITGYVLTGVLKLQQEATVGQQTQTPTTAAATATTTAPTLGTTPASNEEVKTLGIE
jgi:uncharacterized protein YpmS